MKGTGKNTMTKEEFIKEAFSIVKDHVANIVMGNRVKLKLLPQDCYVTAEMFYSIISNLYDKIQTD